MNNGEKEVTGTVPNPGSAAWGVGRYGNYGNYGCSDSGYGYGYSSSYGGNNSEAYYISNPASITDYYTSGMSWNDWIDSQVQAGNASILLGGVTVTAYDQASYDRAAREIWHQICYGTDYSGGGGYSNAVSQSYGRGGSGGKHSVSANVSASAAIANNMANIVGTATSTTSYSARNLSKAKQAKLGYNAIGKIGRGATIVGVAATVISVGSEIINGDVNTHTFVDVGVCAVGIVGTIAATTFSLPALALCVAVGGTIYGFASVCGLSTTIDKATDNWGRKVIYRKEDEDY